MKIIVDIQQQTLHLEGNNPRSYPISSAARGTGYRQGSQQTPLGRHRISDKIGAGLPRWSILEARQPTGKLFTEALRQAYPKKDWVLTRVLWLDGLEPGVNRGGEVDTHDRFIYIHGTSQEHLLGQPASHGCIRMSNADVEELFDLVDVGIEVFIG